MTRQPFRLQPFPADDVPPGLSLEGFVNRLEGDLQLSYRLQGAIERVALPELAETPQRKDDLWRSTCLEFFLAEPGGQGYWEFNLSPSGHWNVYRFTGYRQAMDPELAYTELPFQVKGQRTSLTLDLSLPMPDAALADRPLEMAITAVLAISSVSADQDDTCTYWALSHSGDQPDFHRRSDFRLRL